MNTNANVNIIIKKSAKLSENIFIICLYVALCLDLIGFGEWDGRLFFCGLAISIILSGKRFSPNAIMVILLTIVGLLFNNAIGLFVFRTSVRDALSIDISIMMFVLAFQFYRLKSATPEEIASFSNKFGAFCTIASLAVIVSTFLSAFRNDIQEGFRYQFMLVVCFMPQFCYKKLLIDRQCTLANVFMTFIFILASTMTYSKQVYLGVIFSFLMSHVIYSRKSKNIIKGMFLLLIALVIFLGCILLLSQYSTIMKTVVEAALWNFNILINNENLGKQESYRLMEINLALPFIYDNILTGIGANTVYSSFGLKSWLHVGWMWLLLDFGVLGTALYLWPLLHAGVKFFYRKQKKISEIRKSSIILWVFIVAFCLHNCISPVIFKDNGACWMLGYACGVMLGILGASYAEEHTVV